MTPQPPDAGALSVRDLRIELARSHEDIVDEITLQIAAGEVLGLVGESGSGKTTVGLALLGHQRRGARIAGGEIQIGELDVRRLSGAALRGIRGRLVAYVPQDPGAALNPARRIGAQLHEALRVHDWGGGDGARRARITEVLGEVSLPEDAAFLRRYPHELSGGQQQRVALAIAFAGKPAVVVLDEPTTGLDVTTQAHVLGTVRRMTQVERAAALYVSHDLSVVASFADRVAVMYAGRLVEQGPTAELFATAAHPYTRLLLAAVPRLEAARRLTAIPGRAPAPGTRPPGCPFAPRCAIAGPECGDGLPVAVTVGPGHEARCRRIDRARAEVAASPTPALAAAAPTDRTPDDAVIAAEGLDAGYGSHQVVFDVALSIRARECVALVGESGSGKTTVARALAGLHPAWTGTISLQGAPLAAAVARRPRATQRAIQYVFQNPYGSLNPRRTVGDAVGRPLSLLDVGRREVAGRVAAMLERVSLPAAYAERYPEELSGGERQRVAIARALICEPRVLLCDEVTSALDVSVQAAIVSLLADLQRELGLSILFVTHNLPLVRSIAERLVVMRDGRVVERGPVATVLESPREQYTRRLIADAPRLAAADARAHDPGSVGA